MASEIKGRFLDWYNSLTERDKKILVIFISILLPALSLYIYKKEINERAQLEQKLISLPTINQLKSQILTLEKKRLFYKQQISKLNATLLNPSVSYAYNTQLNQIPIILNNEVNSYGAYITSFEEGNPTRITIDKDGEESRIVSTQAKNKSKNPKQAMGENMFEVELLPVKLVVTTSKDKALSFLNNFNTPNSIYPFVLIKNLSFGFGKNTGCSGAPLENYISVSGNTPVILSPINICMSGYVIASISKVQISPEKGGENAKKH